MEPLVDVHELVQIEQRMTQVMPCGGGVRVLVEKTLTGGHFVIRRSATER